MDFGLLLLICWLDWILELGMASTRLLFTKLPAFRPLSNRISSINIPRVSGPFAPAAECRLPESPPKADEGDSFL
jgi:hypothetical protein